MMFRELLFSAEIPQVVVSSAALPALSSDLSKQITAAWRDQHKQSGKDLFDGKIFQIDQCDLGRNTIFGHFIPYSYLVAVRRIPSLQETLELRPLCVSGCCIEQATGRILLGRRAPWLSSYPGWYELPPSGGVDDSTLNHHRLDLSQQLAKEFEEECALSSNQLLTCSPIGLFVDQETLLYEYCILCKVRQQPLLPSATKEYDILSWVPREELMAKIQDPTYPIIPLSRVFLDHLFSSGIA